jgi:hypothetical protein
VGIEPGARAKGRCCGSGKALVGSGRGRTNLCLVLLDYEDSPRGPYGVYVGMTKHPPAVRATRTIPGSRPLGPPAAVQESFPRFLSSSTRRGSGGGQCAEAWARRADRAGAAPVGPEAGAQAEEIEAGLTEALRAEGLIVEGGH